MGCSSLNNRHRRNSSSESNEIYNESRPRHDSKRSVSLSVPLFYIYMSFYPFVFLSSHLHVYLFICFPFSRNLCVHLLLIFMHHRLYKIPKNPFTPYNRSAHPPGDKDNSAMDAMIKVELTLI